MRIVVTGASSGIGAATARALAERGRTLHLVARTETTLRDVAEEVRGLGGHAEVHPLDATDDGALLAFARSLPDGPDVLVHSAGTIALGPVETMPVEALDRQYRLNVRAPFLLTQALLPGLRAAGGLVVFVNSGSGLRAKADWSGYAASKFALRALADALREEEGAHGVRVTSIYPGRTATPMQQETRRQEGGSYDAADYLPPSEVARMVAEVVRMEPPATVPDVSVRPG